MATDQFDLIRIADRLLDMSRTAEGHAEALAEMACDALDMRKRHVNGEIIVRLMLLALSWASAYSRILGIASTVDSEAKDDVAKDFAEVMGSIRAAYSDAEGVATYLGQTVDKPNDAGMVWRYAKHETKYT